MKNHQPYDIIGDIHGHAGELERLLGKLGYVETGGVYRHVEHRKAIFLGDYIDRGPAILRVLAIVRGMVEGGEALAILGNHEVNLLRYDTAGADGKPLRPQNDQNTAQHAATLWQLAAPGEREKWMAWFSGLPLAIELDGLRVVHACWDDAAVAEMNAAGRLEGAVLERYSRKGTVEYQTISRLINGPEGMLPDGCTHTTGDGRTRREFRLKWWKDLTGATCREAIFPESPSVPDLPPANLPPTGYPGDAPPTFFGHYALRATEPAPVAPYLACLDYGVGKGGFLCAYRWDGEQTIDPGKFVIARG
jgi:hypothetical protein